MLSPRLLIPALARAQASSPRARPSSAFPHPPNLRPPPPSDEPMAQQNNSFGNFSDENKDSIILPGNNLKVKTSRQPAVFFCFATAGTICRPYMFGIILPSVLHCSTRLSSPSTVFRISLALLSLSLSHIGKWKEAVEVGSPAAGACHDPREGAAQRPPGERRCPVPRRAAAPRPP